MKILITVFFLTLISSAFTQTNDDGFQKNKIRIYKSDNLLFLSSNMDSDHSFFGYSEPDTSSTKLILLSVYTKEVEGNPYNCKYGSYYDTNFIKNYELTFNDTIQNYTMVNIIESGQVIDTVYFQSKNIVFEE